MKANELMIGDWLFLGGDVVVQVTAISADGDDTILVKYQEQGKFGKYGEIVGNNDVKPIPITSEILEKNGFRQNWWWKLYNEEFYLSGGGECGYRAYTNGDCNKRENFCWLKYVHELQHALRLCAIDKEIEL